MSGSGYSTLSVDVFQAFENLKDEQLDLEFTKVLCIGNLLLDHMLKVVLHKFEDDVLDQLVLVVP